MTRERLRAALRHLRQVVGGRGGGDVADRVHLERFVAHKDEDAFAAIVRRHGPMVLGVCRRVLANADAAEDAFQATFLVLVQRAGSLRKPELLGPWLYGVAYRASLKARGQALRRRDHERRTAVEAAYQPTDAVGEAELRSILDEEIARLPEKYRQPFVLCYLQERSNEEAARLLGCPVGTVFSRLASARQRLRGQLSRRGLALSAPALTALLVEQTTSAAVPSLLLPSTLGAALLASGKTAAPALSPRVAFLTKEVQRTMFLSKLKPVLALLLAVAVLGPGAAFLIHGVRAGKPESLQQKPPRLPQAAAGGAREKKRRLDDETGKEHARLQGNWRRLHTLFADDEPTVFPDKPPTVIGGGYAPLFEFSKASWDIEEDRIAFSYVLNELGDLPELKKEGRRATYRIDPRVSPKAFDLVREDGKMLPGIYLLEGDILVVCLKEVGQERPKALVSDPKSGQRLLVFQRIHEK